MKSKKPIIVLVIVLCLAAAAGVFIFLYNKRGGKAKSDRLVYVETVRTITGVPLGTVSRFMGVVESQETKSVKKESNQSVKEIFVKEGDNVKEGDKLFSYDTSEMEMTLEQMRLERTGIQNSIDGHYASIEDYKAQRDSAKSEEERLSYTSQINSTSATIKEEEYNLSSKDLEITRQEEAIKNAIVTSPMAGVIKKINSSGAASSSDDEDDFTPYGDSSSDADGFITIIAEGDYRIRGIADELNIRQFTSGTKVILRSRIDESVTWNGTVSKVDLEPKKNNSDYGYDSSGGESASKYSFYVNPEGTDGMMLGQHLFLELDKGQNEQKEGIYLPSYYLIQDENGSFFVWKKGKDDRIEKTEVIVGEFDEEEETYEIKSGLSLDDYIAFPQEGVEEGCPTTTNYEDIEEQEMDDMSDEEFDDSMLDEMTPGDSDFLIDPSEMDGPIIDDPSGESSGESSDGPVTFIDDGSDGSDGADSFGGDSSDFDSDSDFE